MLFTLSAGGERRQSLSRLSKKTVVFRVICPLVKSYINSSNVTISKSKPKPKPCHRIMSLQPKALISCTSLRNPPPKRPQPNLQRRTESLVK